MTCKVYQPKLPGFQVEQVRWTQEQVIIVARAVSLSTSCSRCGKSTQRVHSWHIRRLRDLPWSGKAVQLLLHMHRFFCDNPGCLRQTFAEQVPAITCAYARRTCHLTEILYLLSMALGGEASARVVDRLNICASPDTLIRLIRQRSSRIRFTPPLTPRVLGVDDWALRKGRTYGTILVDLEQHRPIDLLPERSATSLAAWLREHPGVEIITRDRCGMYAEGASQGAPQALQVADRWHLLQNLREALERVVERHPACLKAFAVEVPLRSKNEEQRRHAGRSQRYARYDQVITLQTQGFSERAIARQLNLSRLTVRRYIYAGSFPEIACRKQPRSMLRDYKPYLEQQWASGRENATQLWRELKAMGYPGSYKLIAVWANRQRKLRSSAFSSLSVEDTATEIKDATVKASAGVLPAVMRVPSAHQVVWLFLRQPKQLSPEEQSQLGLLCQTSDDLCRAYHAGQSFLQMIRDRQPEALLPWLDEVQREGPAALQGFVQGIRRDFAAVKAAMTVEWSNGQVEGQVNRLKLIKCQMYGRANFDLLRLRVLAP